ncbi:hypothetical protein BOX15_Mlig026110g1 [Macrostomum lignano]|uniref:DM2 domain-containing protein n=1 Tax=Macrostomum lignano TaxID=282301 RepID=A0A267G6J4_9PLAT|nr:hypothetical protein BOX15_Mlig026110g1 [Macrostomum lignano]
MRGTPLGTMRHNQFSFITHVVKRLWDIAKEREMFDPKNKQFVICDAEFEQLFGKKRLRMFALMKYLKNHVKNVD